MKAKEIAAIAQSFLDHFLHHRRAPEAEIAIEGQQNSIIWNPRSKFCSKTLKLDVISVELTNCGTAN